MNKHEEVSNTILTEMYAEATPSVVWAIGVNPEDHYLSSKDFDRIFSKHFMRSGLMRWEEDAVHLTVANFHPRKPKP